VGSFCNEQTIEYALVPRLTKALMGQYAHVIPFRFWASREGSRSALNSSNTQLFRLLTVFARRPKFPGYASGVHVKINRDVQDQARAHWQVGIPTIAATVSASHLSDILPNTPATYFHIPPVGADQEFVLTVGTEAELIAGDDPPAILSENDVLQLVDAQAARTYSDWVAAIREARRLMDDEEASGEHWLFGPTRYKPLYLLLG